VTITQLEIRFKTKVSHKHMVVIYHQNTPLPKVRKGLDRYKAAPSPASARLHSALVSDSSRSWREEGNTLWYQASVFAITTLPV
jgi:hypothetical protein